MYYRAGPALCEVVEGAGCGRGKMEVWGTVADDITYDRQSGDSASPQAAPIARKGLSTLGKRSKHAKTQRLAAKIGLVLAAGH